MQFGTMAWCPLYAGVRIFQGSDRQVPLYNVKVSGQTILKWPSCVQWQLRPGSQYDAGAMSIVSVTGKVFFFYQSNCIPDVNFFNNLIGWTLANACDTMLE